MLKTRFWWLDGRWSSVIQGQKKKLRLWKSWSAKSSRRCKSHVTMSVPRPIGLCDWCESWPSLNQAFKGLFVTENEAATRSVSTLKIYVLISEKSAIELVIELGHDLRLFVETFASRISTIRFRILRKSISMKLFWSEALVSCSFHGVGHWWCAS